MVLVGGGLANGLIALRLRTARPELRLLIVEAGTPARSRSYLVVPRRRFGDRSRGAGSNRSRRIRGPSYTVAFPELRRGLDARLSHDHGGPVSCRRERRAGGWDQVRGPGAIELGPNHVRLGTGELLTAAAVIDGRGPLPTRCLDLAFQKFVGRELRLARPHGLTDPMLMDATVPQTDGYRFVYLLPFDPETLLVEDTYYSDSPDLDLDALRLHIRRVCRLAGTGRSGMVVQRRTRRPADCSGRRFRCVLGRGSGRDPALGATGRAVPPDDRLLAARSGKARRPHRGAAGSVLGRARRENS